MESFKQFMETSQPPDIRESFKNTPIFEMYM